MEKTVNNKNINSNYKTILKGSIISIILSIVLLFIFALILVNTNIKDSIIKPGVIVIMAIGILIGSSISTIKIKKNGILYGGCVGAIDIIVMYLISSIITSGFSLNTDSIIMITTSIITGILGGIIGVNMK